MADVKISELTDGGAIQDTDLVLVTRGSGNNKVSVSSKADAAATQTALDTKANAIDVTNALANKADAASTAAALNDKADAAATATALDSKADDSATTAALNLKADAAATTSSLNQKADDAATTAALNLKADQSALDGTAPVTLTIKSRSVDYTTVLEDDVSIITMDSGSSTTITIPSNASVGYPVGTTLSFVRVGSGVTTVSGATGVTVNGTSAGNAIIGLRYYLTTAVKTGTDEWSVGIVSDNSLTATGVTPGSYTNSNITVNEFGQLTAAASGSSGGAGAAGKYATWEKIEPGLSAADFNTQLAAAITSARIAQTGVLLLDGNHDGSSANNISLSGNIVPIRGESMVNTRVTLPGTSKSLATSLFSVTGSVDVADITFSGGGQVFGIPSGLNNKINAIFLDHITYIDAGALIRYDSQNPQGGASFGKVEVTNTEGYNVNHGTYLLCGSSNGVAQVDQFISHHNLVDGFAGTAIGCFATDPIAGNAYAAGYHGSAHIHDNRILHGLGTDASLVVSYGITATACRHAKINDNFLYDLKKGALQRVKAIYSKSETYEIDNNHLIDAGDNDTTGGGSITAKGDDQGTVTQFSAVRWNRVETSATFASGSEGTPVDNSRGVDDLTGIWAQAANLEIKGNRLKGHWGGGHISTQSSTEHQEIKVDNNTFEVLASNAFGDAVINIIGWWNRASCTRNRVFNRVGNSDAIVFYTGTASNRTIVSGLISGNELHNISGGTGQAIRIHRRNSASMADLAILRNTVWDFDTVIQFENQAVDTTTAIMYNVAFGQSTNISNGVASPVSEKFNSWN